MILGASDSPAAVYSRAADRAMGATGIALGRSIVSALSMPDFEDRGAEIYRRVSEALHRASQDDATLTSPEAVGRALEILALLPKQIPLPEVVVESEGEIGFDWDEGSRRVVSLTVRDTPVVGFAALLGEEPVYGRMRFGGEIPETLRFLLARLYTGRARP